MSVTEICTMCTNNKHTPHVKLLCPSKNGFLRPSSPCPGCLLAHIPTVSETTNLFLKKVQYGTFFPLKTKTFLLHYSPRPLNEKSIIIYTSVQALLYVRNPYCIIQKYQNSNKLLNKLG